MRPQPIAIASLFLLLLSLALPAWGKNILIPAFHGTSIGIVQDQQPATQSADSHPSDSKKTAAPTRIEEKVLAASLVRQVTPVYPAIAKNAHVEGTVVLHALIGTDGAVQDLQYVSGPPLLMRAALDAVWQWKYKPTLINGEPVRIDTTISVVFTLGGAKHDNAQSITPATHDTALGPESYADEPYIYEQVRGKMRYENDGTGTREIIARMRVQSVAGLAKVGQLVFDYSAANERMEIRKLRVTKPDGSIVTAGTDAVQDLNAPVALEAPMYTDARQKHVTVPGLAVGDVIEYDVVTTTFEPMLPGQFWQTWNIVSDAICLDEQVDLSVPRERALKVKSPDGVVPTMHDDGDRRIYHWATSTLERPKAPAPQLPFKLDVKALLEGVRAPKGQTILFSTFQSWDEIAKWYARLEGDRRDATPEVRAEAEKIVAGETTEEGRARALYEWVSGNIRYVSLSFGVGRYQPHSASEVLRNRYGDCKDKTTLLEALLEAEGMHASAVLVNATADIDPEVPTPHQFDHAITFVSFGGQDHWLDPTVGVGPFGYLLPQLRGKYALIASPSGSWGLRRTPEELPFETLYQFDIEGTISDDRKMDARLSFDARGDWEVFMRIACMKLSPQQMNVFTEAMTKGAATARNNRGDFSFSDFHAGDPNDIRKPFHVEVRMHGTVPGESQKDSSAPEPARTKGLAEIAPLMAYFLPAAESSVGSDGKKMWQTVKIGGPKQYAFSVTFTLPPKKDDPAHKPTHLDISKDFGEFKLDADRDDQTVRAKALLELRTAEVSAEKAEEYDTFRKSIMDSLGAAEPKSVTPAPADAKESYRAGVESFKNRDYTTARHQLEAAVEKDASYGVAWDELGRTYMSLGLPDKAEDAFHKAIAINPNERTAYSNLATVLLGQQKYDEAIQLFQKQIELNPKDSYPYWSLGRAYLELEKYDLAQKEFDSALTVGGDSAANEVLIGRAQLGLNQPEKARQAFDRALERSPTATTWNEVAYYLALQKLDLDHAQNYAESAVSATSTLLRNVSLDQISMSDLGQTTAITRSWDTLGWVRFQQGDVLQAEKLVAAAWANRESGEIGDHLAQIYEKEGRKAEAIHQYELALAARRPLHGTRPSLKALLGSDSNIEQLVTAAAPELVARRTVKVANSDKASGSADFWILFTNSKPAPEVRFISGDEKVRPLVSAIQQASFPSAFPDATDTKILRRGTLSCSADAAECLLVLLPVEDVHSVN
jgi:TonB family protein